MSLSDRDFERVRSLIEQTVGIQLPDHKRGMVELRLTKRVRSLGISGLAEYCSLVLDNQPDSAERLRMIDAITTNKTDFFRESSHFDTLVNTLVPEFIAKNGCRGVHRSLNIWSAGCSTGEEPYSIAIALDDYTSSHPRFEFEVHATDVSMTALTAAMRAVYAEERACAIPPQYRRRSLLRHKDHSLNLVRVAPEIRKRVSFSKYNLLSDLPPNGGPFDVVFCRNVIIYFDRTTQIAVLRNIVDALRPLGHLFVGHSETLHGMPLPLRRIGPTLYQKTDS